MSLYKDASLVMIPSAYKDGKLYSIRPTDGSGDFTFSRGSNLAATRVDVNGLIEKGRENLVTYSNNFNNWSKASGASVTSGQAGYDGSSDAWLATSVSNTQPYQVYKGWSTYGVLTFSVYAKANTGTIFNIDFAIPDNGYVRVDLSDGSVISESGSSTYIGSNVVSVGGGWYRISVTANVTNSAYIRAGLYQTAGSVYIQDAQVEQGLVATDYIETGASTAQAGILEDMPRLDYSGSCPALLLEPQRTNVVSQSEYFGDSSWNNSNQVTRSISSTSSPEGKLNAYDIIPTTSNTNHTLRAPNLSGFTSGAVVNVSFFAKANGYKFISVVGGFGSSSTPAVVFNLDEGTITSGTGTIEAYGNGWYRCVSPITLNATALYCVATILDDNESGSFAGDGTSAVIVYGYQIEEASYPTSYIPTYGSSVTRSQDAMYKTGVSDLIGSSLGTIFIHTTFDSTPTYTQRVYKIDDGTSNNMIGFSRYGADNLNVYFQSNGTSSVAIVKSGTIPKGTEAKVAISYEEDRVKVFLNGVEIASDTSAAMPVGLSRILFSNDTSGNLLSDQHISQFATFPTALTDSECIALTTL